MQQVDDPRQLVLGADRQVHGDAALGELLAELLERAEEVGALAVEHVHEDDAREPERLGAVPDAARLHLDAHHAADHESAPSTTRSAASVSPGSPRRRACRSG